MLPARFKRLFAEPAAALRVVRGEASEPEILLYDEIGFWGITAEAFRRELTGIDAPTIHLRINSPGGDVFDGIAMYNALIEHPARVIVHIDAWAASMASMVAMAGNEIRIAETGFLMIHDPWTIAVGNAREFRSVADVLDKLSGAMQLAYQQKTGAEPEQVRAWMEAETWFNAAEARDRGFVDEVTGRDDEALKQASALFDLSVFAHVPEALKAAGADLVDPRVDEDQVAADLLRLRLDLAAKT